MFHNGDIAVDPWNWNNVWRDDDMEDIIMDFHFYTAWQHGFKDVKDACDYYETWISAYADMIKYPKWVGEWSLATDVCAHWLGGFNDNKLHMQNKCRKVECPVSYMSTEVVDFDRAAAGPIGPYGTTEYVEENCISHGMCNDDSYELLNATQVRELGQCVLDTFDRHVNASFMWTGHNEITPKWDYIRAWDLMWINKTEVPLAQQISYNFTEGKIIGHGDDTAASEAIRVQNLLPKQEQAKKTVKLDFIQ